MKLRTFLMRSSITVHIAAKSIRFGMLVWRKILIGIHTIHRGKSITPIIGSYAASGRADNV